MGEVLTAAAIMAGLALFFAVILATAYALLRVEEDPRIDDVEGMLPGSNCGACGSPGCRAFAELLVGGGAAPGKCTVNSAAGTEAIAGYLGVDAGGEEKRVARLKCAGGQGLAGELAGYVGLSSCRAAAITNGGGRACEWGCLGLGDCARACGFDAITMSARGLPVVSLEGCTACNDCVEVCPLDLLVLAPAAGELLVQCNSPLKGAEARSRCDVACDACGRCAADAPAGAITMERGLPVVHRDAPARGTAAATYRCPTGAIQWVDGQQFPEETGVLTRGSHA